tara:strand:- start:100 stop:231 length:132 start_codon:yes stop_codon:yes gene_type:complete
MKIFYDINLIECWVIKGYALGVKRFVGINVNFKNCLSKTGMVC